MRELADKERLEPLNEGLLEEDVERELAVVEVLVLDLDLDEDLWASDGVMSVLSIGRDEIRNYDLLSRGRRGRYL